MSFLIGKIVNFLSENWAYGIVILIPIIIIAYSSFGSNSHTPTVEDNYNTVISSTKRIYGLCKEVSDESTKELKAINSLSGA